MQFLCDTRHEPIPRISASTRELQRMVSLFECRRKDVLCGEAEKPEVTVLWNEAEGLLPKSCHLSLEGEVMLNCFSISERFLGTWQGS